MGASGGVNLLPPQLLGPLGLDVGEVGVPCHVAMVTTPTPTSQSTKRDSSHPHSQEEPGSGWESSLGNPLSDAGTKARPEGSFRHQRPTQAGWPAHPASGPAVQAGAGPFHSGLYPPKLSCPSPTAKAALGLLSCSDEALTPYSLPEARDPHYPQQAARLWERRGGGHSCHPPSAPLRHYSLSILPPPSAR